MLIPDAVRSLERDLRDIFGNRMQSLVAYAPVDRSGDQPTLVVVERLTADDLRSCASRVAEWRDARLATPLILETHELTRSIDAFPLEFSAMLAQHEVVAGINPFEGLQVSVADLRRACEVQARSHLLHLREGYIDTEGRGDRVTELITRSAWPLAALIRSVRYLDDGYLVPSVLERVMAAATSPPSADEARRIISPYLTAVHQLTAHIDGWGSP